MFWAMFAPNFPCLQITLRAVKALRVTFAFSAVLAEQTGGTQRERERERDRERERERAGERERERERGEAPGRRESEVEDR